MTRKLCLPLVFLLLLPAAGCGSKQDSLTSGRADRLSVMLDFFPNADHTGLYLAEKRGLFRQSGLDVQVLTPSDPSAPLKLLAAGKVDLAISYEPEVLLARDKGAPLVSVAAIVQKPLTSIIALPGSKIRRPADLEGKRVGTAGIPYQSAYLKTIAERAGVRSVKEVGIGFNLNGPLLAKKVDATLGGFSNYEAIQLALRDPKRKPVVIPVDQAGVPPYDELVLVARASTLSRRGDQVRAFVQALGRGYAGVRANPGAGVDALLAAVPDLRPNRALQEASVKATIPAWFGPANRPYGFQDPVAWRRYGEWMLSHKLLEHPPRAPDALTNEFLAGRGS